MKTKSARSATASITTMRDRKYGRVPNKGVLRGEKLEIKDRLDFSSTGNGKGQNDDSAGSGDGFPRITPPRHYLKRGFGGFHRNCQYAR